MKKLGLSLAIAAALGLSACGGGSSGGGGGSSTTVEGVASKGIIANGLVSAFLFADDGTPEGTAIATATTDASGNYSLNIPSEHRGKPLYIKVSNNADGNATMKCDISPGCDSDGDGTDDVLFGAPLTLSSSFNMEAVVPEATGSVSVNVTPLTTAASKKARAAIETAGSSFGAKAQIASANSSVANTLNNLLGLSGDEILSSINDVEVVDLTDTTDVATKLAGTSGSVAVKVAAIGAAVVKAVQSGNTNTTLDDAIENFAEELAEAPLTNDSADDTVTDAQDLLSAASDVIAEVVSDVTEALGEEADILDELSGEGSISDVIADAATDAAEAGDTTVDDTPSPTAGAEELAQVKAFVAELRDIGTAIDESMAGSGNNEDTVANILDSFDLQIDAADMVSGDDASNAMEGLAKAVEAMAYVYEELFTNDDGLIQPGDEGYPTAGNYTSEDGTISVNLSFTNSVPVLNVDDSEISVDDGLATADVNVTATLTDTTFNDSNYTETETETVLDESGSLSASLNMNLNGSTSSSGTVDLTVNTGSVTGSAGLVLDNTFTDTQSGYTDDIDETFTLTSFAFNLNVTLAHNESLDSSTEVSEGDGVEQILASPRRLVEITESEETVDLDAMTFTGGLSFTATNWAFSEDSTETADWSNDNFTYDENYRDTFDFGIVSLDIDGTFGNSTESFDLSLSIDADGRSVPNLVDIYDTQDGDSETGGETSSRYASGSVALTFDAMLGGVADEVQFSFLIERAGQDDVDAEVTLSYPGRTITIESEWMGLDTDDSATASLTLTNNDGVVIQMDADESIANEDDELTGNITLDSTEYAVLDVVDGVELVRYSDGTFETIF